MGSPEPATSYFPVGPEATGFKPPGGQDVSGWVGVGRRVSGWEGWGGGGGRGQGPRRPALSCSSTRGRSAVSNSEQFPYSVRVYYNTLMSNCNCL